MQFEVLTDEQIEAKQNEIFKNLKEGVASFVVMSAKEDRSKAGNDMLTLDLECIDADGTKGNVRTWLLLPHIIKHFCESVGSPEQYFTGKLSASFCQGKTGLCKLKMGKERKGKDKEGNDKIWPARIELDDFVKPEDGKYDGKDVEFDLNDDIPF